MLKLRFLNEEIAMFFRNIVESTVKVREEQDIVRPDMLQLMMESRKKKDSRHKLTIEEMAVHAFGFFLGGFDTSSTLMSFAAYEIAVNEDVQKRLQKEIDQVLEDTNGQVNYDAINNMEYLDAVLNETLRMYPVAPLLDRVCQQDFELPPTLPGAKPYTIKKGDAVFIPVYGLHHDPKYFKQPEKFDPDRFLGEQKKRILNTGAFLPFGLGPRMCIGNRFAMLETKLLFLHLLARCDLLPCKKTPMSPKLCKKSFLTKLEGGTWLKVMSRKDSHHFVTLTMSSC